MVKSMKEQLISDINALPEQVVQAISVLVKEFVLLNDNATSITGRTSGKDRTAMFGCLRGKYIISDDFDAPLDDFKEYMQ